MQINYKDVLYFSQIRWLSRGKTLKTVWDLRREIAFYTDFKGKAHEFFNAQWLSKLAFLVDITEKLNYLNESLQGKKKLIHNLFAEIKAFEAKLKLWQKQLRQNVFDRFPCLRSELVDGESDNGATYADEIIKLQREFDRRF